MGLATIAKSSWKFKIEANYVGNWLQFYYYYEL